MPSNYIAVNKNRGYLEYKGLIVQIVTARDGIYLTSVGPQQPVPRIDKFDISNGHVVSYVERALSHLGIYDTQSFSSTQVVGTDGTIMMIVGTTDNLIATHAKIL